MLVVRYQITFARSKGSISEDAIRWVDYNRKVAGNQWQRLTQHRNVRKSEKETRLIRVEEDVSIYKKYTASIVYKQHSVSEFRNLKPQFHKNFK